MGAVSLGRAGAASGCSPIRRQSACERPRRTHERSAPRWTRCSRGCLAAAATSSRSSGEPGIGKSRLLADLAAAAPPPAASCSAARASEFEADLPYALWTEALDRAPGRARRARGSAAEPAALAALLPALATRARAGDRHRTTARCATCSSGSRRRGRSSLWLDDVHWADPASLDALAALVRRPPAGPVLLAVAAREGRLPAALAAALAAAARDGRVTDLPLAPLSEAEAARAASAQAPPRSTRVSGGNPFYLEQLARGRRGGAGVGSCRRGRRRAGRRAGGARRRTRGGCSTRRRWSATRSSPALAAEVAELSEAAALARSTSCCRARSCAPAAPPRRFAFRHPVVRHAVYDGAPGGWRLGAHARAAAALERARRRAGGARPPRRARRAARRRGRRRAAERGRARAAGARRRRRAARFHAAALRLLPDGADARATRRDPGALAEAQARPATRAGARATLLDALGDARDAQERLRLDGRASPTRSVARRATSRRAGGCTSRSATLPAEPSPDRIRLHLALGARRAPGLRLRRRAGAGERRARRRPRRRRPGARGGGADARRDRRASADGEDGARRADEPFAAFGRLTDAQLARAFPALWMLALGRQRARRATPTALADLDRARRLARRDRARAGADARRGRVGRGRCASSAACAEAVATGEEALDRARLGGNPQQLLWAHCALAARPPGRRRRDRRAARGRGGRRDRAPSRASTAPASRSWALGAALTAAGNAERAVPLLQDGAPRRDPGAARRRRGRPRRRAARGGRRRRRGRARAVAARPTARRRARAARPARRGPSRARPPRRRAAGARVSADAPRALRARSRAARWRRPATARRRSPRSSPPSPRSTASARVRRRDEAVRELRRLGHRVRAAPAGEARGSLTGASARSPTSSPPAARTARSPSSSC